MGKGRIRKETGNKKTLFTNDTMSKECQKSNCGKGYIGGMTTYYVKKGTHIATTKEEANQMAIDDMEKNAQAFANTNGTCTPINEPQVLLKADTFNVVSEVVETSNITIKNVVPKKIVNKQFLLIIDIMVGTQYIAEGLVVDASEGIIVYPYTNPDNKSVRIDIQKLMYNDALVGEYSISKVTPDDEQPRLSNFYTTNPQTISWSTAPGDVNIDIKYNAHKQPTIELLGGWRDCDGIEMQIFSSTFVPDFVKEYPIGFITKQWDGKGVVISPDLREIGNKMKDIEIHLIPTSKGFQKFNFEKLETNVGETEQIDNIGVIKLSQLGLDTDVKIEFYVIGQT